MPAKKLEKLPGFTVGLRDNAAIRMRKLARPICPNSKLNMVKDEEGKWVPAEVQPQNCQRAGGAWWEQCEDTGHDPYFTNRVWYEPQDRIEEDEAGNQIVTGTIRIKHVNRYPNIAQVAIALRINSGRGAERAVKMKGFKRLPDIGYEEVCQFRNCQRSLSGQHNSVTYGNYCGMPHLSLAAASEDGLALHIVNDALNGQEAPKVQRLRDKELREIGAHALSS